MERSDSIWAVAAEGWLWPVLLAAVSFVVGFSLSAIAWRVLRSRMGRRTRWMGLNYRRKPLVAVAGLILVAAGGVTVVVAAILTTVSIDRAPAWNTPVPTPASAPAPVLAFARSPSSAAAAGAIAALLALAGFGWLGYRDDTAAASDHPDSDARARDARGRRRPGSSRVLDGADSGVRPRSGFAGHLRRSLRQRRLTTGMQKALGGIVVAAAAAQIALWGDVGPPWGAADGESTGGGWVAAVLRSLGLSSDPAQGWNAVALVRAALIVALSANLLNLLDRAPGRAAKSALMWWAALLVSVAAGPDSAPWLPLGGLGFEAAYAAVLAGAVTGAAAGLLPSELQEEHMLGDTGVNALGAVAGLATVAVCSATFEWVALAVLAALNLLSERWSFSRVIDSVAPLRWLDRLGSPYRDA